MCCRRWRAGDFDGDGLRDLVVGESLARLVVRLALGERGQASAPSRPRSPSPTQTAPWSATSTTASLDDVAAWDTRYGRSLVVLRNRGRLARPGELRVSPRPSRPSCAPPTPSPTPLASPGTERIASEQRALARAARGGGDAEVLARARSRRGLAGCARGSPPG